MRSPADYIGQRSITSIQHIRYNPGVVVASVVIACVAISAGLWIMFIVLRPKLKHSYLKRALVACFLGSATSAMVSPRPDPTLVCAGSERR